MTIAVMLLCSPAAREVFEQTIEIAPGTTAAALVADSRLHECHPGLDWRAMTPGVWGKAVDWDRVLVEGDRLELCRQLTVDPKVARRERFQRQGARATGLFARRREGGKAGY